MSNNEEKMREENLIAVCRENGCTYRQAANIRDFVSQTTASKQQEIDALNKQVLELSATVERMREEAARFTNNYDKPDFNTHLCAKVISDAIASLEPSTALRDYVNEEVANALEDAANRGPFGHDTQFELREMAAERRNRK